MKKTLLLTACILFFYLSYSQETIKNENSLSTKPRFYKGVSSTRNNNLISSDKFSSGNSNNTTKETNKNLSSKYYKQISEDSIKIYRDNYKTNQTK